MTNVERKIASTEAIMASATKVGSNGLIGVQPRFMMIQPPNTTKWR